MGLIDGFNSKIMCEDFCLADNATTHTILKGKKIFLTINLKQSYCQYDIRFNEPN